MSAIQPPFTKAKRRLIFYVCLLAFVILAPLIGFYSIGYNVDFKTRQLLSTGGIFVKTNETNFKVSINGTQVRETGFLSHGALITDLKPDLYLVKIEKDGFTTWQRFVHIEPTMISEFRFITLFPKEAQETEVLDLSRRGLTIDSFQPLAKSAWVIISVVEKKNITYFFDEDTNYLDAVASFDAMRWDSAGERLLVHHINSGRWAMISLARGQIREEQLVFPKSLGVVSAVDFFPGDTGGLLVLNADGVLQRYAIATRTPQPFLSDITALQTLRDRVYFIQKNGFFASVDATGGDVQNYGRKGFYIAATPIEVDATNAGDVFLIDSGGGLFVKRRDETEVTPITGSARGAALTSDGERLLFWTEHDIEVIWLTDEVTQPFRSKGTRERIITFPDQSITTCVWLLPDEENILFWAGTFIGGVDIDDRAGGPSATILLDSVHGWAAFQENGAQQMMRSEKSFLFSAKPY